MSDQTIDQLSSFLKSLNTRLEKLNRTIDQLEIGAYRYQRLSYEVNQIDVMAFEIRQEFDHLREMCWRMKVVLENNSYSSERKAFTPPGV